jgi:hypothetical protein
MALGFITRAMRAGLAKLGEPSFLDGVDIGPVNIEVGVDMYVGDPGRSDDNFTAQVDVAVIPREAAPAVGQVLTHPNGTFVLSRKLEDNGYTLSFIVVAQ